MFVFWVVLINLESVGVFGIVWFGLGFVFFGLGVFGKCELNYGDFFLVNLSFGFDIGNVVGYCVGVDWVVVDGDFVVFVILGECVFYLFIIIVIWEVFVGVCVVVFFMVGCIVDGDGCLVD